MNLDVASKNYFSTLNLLAEKIAADIENTRDAYQDLWSTMSKNEQDQAINENLINPTAVLKYANLPPKVLKENYHPFSWFTKSQLNLFDQFEQLGYTDSKNILCRNDTDRILPLLKNETDVTTIKKSKEEKTKNHKGVLKPKGPPPPPPAKFTQVEEPSKGRSSHGIPKTGFDFLDNW